MTLIIDTRYANELPTGYTYISGVTTETDDELLTAAGINPVRVWNWKVVRQPLTPDRAVVETWND